MRYTPQAIPEIIRLTPKIFRDDRGYFIETFRQDQFEEAIGIKVIFIQENESKSLRGTLRGLHYQRPHFSLAKLVRVLKGEILDVVVDIRQGSPTFRKAITVILNDENKHQLFIPRGFAHGFVVLSETATFTYKVDNYYSPDSERGVAYNDPPPQYRLAATRGIYNTFRKRPEPSKACSIGSLFSIRCQSVCLSTF
jgi:dTDP-4-dehydrorhamnose 3,5-epimerase